MLASKHYLLAVASLLVARTDACPSTVTCITSDTVESCQERGLYLKDNVLFNGCCPGCVELPESGETCDPTTGCAPGLICNNKMVCVVDKTKGCYKARKETDPGYWAPDCMADGSYAPKQCKGEPLSGRCFCFDPDGNRIFGEEYWHLAENMTCGCSRLMWEELKVRGDASLHCNSQGNFEELQCDDGLCWCANEITGKPFYAVVSEGMMRTLPCFNETIYGEQYLRQCDSIRVAQYRSNELLTIHGTSNVYFNPVSCSYDGSFARVQVQGGRNVCSSKDNHAISQYNSDPSEKTTCNCNYDSYIADEIFNFVCIENGDYKREQTTGGQTYCVDKDGYNAKCP